MLTITTILTSDREPFDSVLKQRDEIRTTKAKFSPCSDHLALAWLYQEWEDKSNRYKREEFCDETYLNHGRMMTLRGMFRSKKYSLLVM